MLVIRPIKKNDFEILRLATFYNLNWETERFSLSEIDSNSRFNYYYNNWDSEDFGFIAQRHQQVLGVIWLKYFTEDDPGFGFLDINTLELSLCVFPDFRNNGLGKQLLQYAIEEAQKRNLTSISLSVELANIIARKLYESFGFEYVEDTDGIMILI